MPLLLHIHVWWHIIECRVRLRVHLLRWGLLIGKVLLDSSPAHHLHLVSIAVDEGSLILQIRLHLITYPIMLNGSCIFLFLKT